MKKRGLIIIFVLSLLFITSCQYLPKITGKQIQIIELTDALTDYNLNTQDLVLYWNFDQENSVSILDQSGNNRNGAITDSPVWSLDTPSEEGYSLSLDGNNDYVQFAPGSYFVPTGNSYTVMGWYKTTDFGSNYFLDWATSGYRVDSYSGFGTSIYQSNKITSRLEVTGPGDWPKMNSYLPVSYNNEEWNHYALVFQNATSTEQSVMKIYINGELADTVVNDNILRGSRNIGIFGIGIINSHPYNGLVDEVFLFNRTLDENEIRDYYNNIINHPAEAPAQTQDTLTEDTLTEDTATETPTEDTTHDNMMGTDTQQGDTSSQEQQEQVIDQGETEQKIQEQQGIGGIEQPRQIEEDKRVTYFKKILNFPKIDIKLKEDIKLIPDLIINTILGITDRLNIEIPAFKIEYKNNIFSNEFVEDEYNIISNENIFIPNTNIRIKDYLVIDNVKIPLYKEKIDKILIRKETRISNKHGKILYGFKNYDDENKNVQFIWEIKIPSEFSRINSFDLNKEFTDNSADYRLYGDRSYYISFNDVKTNFDGIYSSYNPETRVLSVYSKTRILQQDEEIILDPEWYELLDAEGLVLHWNFDQENSVSILDQSGNNRNGAITSSPVWSLDTPGNQGYSLSLDGDNDYVQFAPGSYFVPTGSNYTVMGWYKTTDFSSNYFLDWATSGYRVDSYSGFGTSIDQPNKITSHLEVTGPGDWPKMNSYLPVLYNNEEWNHYALVFKNATSTEQSVMEIYINGELADTVVNDNLLRGSRNIGIFSIGIINSHPYNGLVDEVFLFNRALDENEISSYYQGVRLPNCGDGLIDGIEECDDGNINSGDGCSAICSLEEGWICNGNSPSYCTSQMCSDLGGYTCYENEYCAVQNYDTVKAKIPSLLYTYSGTDPNYEISLISDGVYHILSQNTGEDIYLGKTDKDNTEIMFGPGFVVNSNLFYLEVDENNDTIYFALTNGYSLSQNNNVLFSADYSASAEFDITEWNGSIETYQTTTISLYNPNHYTLFIDGAPVTSTWANDLTTFSISEGKYEFSFE